MSNKSSISNFFKHSTIYAFGNVLNRIGAFALLPIYTTYLTISEYGSLELYYVTSSVVSGILAIGLAHATLRFYFEYDDIEDRHALVSTNLIASGLISLFGALIVFIFSDELAEFVFNSSDTGVLLGLYIVLATMILEMSSQICLAYVRAKELSTFYVALSLIKLIVQVSINSYLVIVEKAGITGILFGNLCAVGIGWLILIGYTLTRCGIHFHINKMKDVISYSFPFLLGTLVGIVAVNADRFMLNHFLGLAAVGVYSLALKLTMLIDVLVVEPFSKSYGAYRFSIMKNNDASAVQNKITRYMTIIISITLISIVYSSHEIITIMSNPEYYAAVTILPVLIFVGGFKVFTYIFQTGILYAKATKHMFRISIVACLSIIILNYIFINLFGLLGAVIAKVLTSIIVLYVTNSISQRYMKIDYPYVTMLKVLLITILFIVLGVAANNLDFWFAILMKSFLFSLLILTLYHGGILNLDEKLEMKTFIKKQLSRIT